MKKILWSALLVVVSLGLMSPMPAVAQDVSEDVIKALEEAAKNAKEKEQAEKAAAEKAAAEKAAAEKAAAEKAAAEKAAAEKAAAEKAAKEKAAAEKAAAMKAAADKAAKEKAAADITAAQKAAAETAAAEMARQEAQKKARMEAEARKAAESRPDDAPGEKDIHRLYDAERKRLLKETGQPVDEKPAAPKPVVPTVDGPGKSAPAPEPGSPSAIQKPLANPVPTFQPGQKVVTPESNAPDYRRSIELLLQGASSQNAMVRANSLEALHLVPERAKPLVLKLLNDPNEGVRFTAAMSAGMLKLVDIAPAVRPLLKDSSRSVQAAAIYALFAMKQDVNINPLAEMLMSQDRVLRSNVVMVLGEMGEPSAIGLLKSSLRSPMPRESKERMAVLRVFIAESMVKLGDTASLEALRAGAYSSLGEVQAVSITAMGATGDKSMVKAIERFLKDPEQTRLESSQPRYPIEVKLAAAGALGRLDVATGLNVALQSLSDPNPVIASQAAWALGWYKDPVSLAKLQATLEHPNELVQVSAAASILRRQARGGLAGRTRGE